MRRPVESFAYPYGDADARVRAAVGRHFRLAYGTRLAFVRAGSDLLELPRIDIFYVRRRRWFEALPPGGAAYMAARRWIQELPRGRAAGPAIGRRKTSAPPEQPQTARASFKCLIF